MAMEPQDEQFCDIEHGNEGEFSPLPNHVPKLIISASEPGHKLSSTTIPVPELQRNATAPVLTSSEQSKGQSLFHNLNILTSLPPLPLPLLRRRSTSVPVFYCHICMENHALQVSFDTESCTMHHKFCMDMLGGYITSQINDGMVNLHCPCFGEGCNGKYSDLDVQTLVDNDTYHKYLRFAAIKNNPDYRECPKCNASVMGNKDTPAITCASCGELYCFFHSNAHPNMSCSQYSREQTRKDKQSSTLIRRVARNCPQCNAPTEKNGGCNHMTCQHCGESWCWLCGRKMASNHYDDFLNGCPGAQFSAAPSFALWTLCPCVRSPVWGHIFRIPYYLLVLAIVCPLLIVPFFGLAVMLGFLPITGSVVVFNRYREGNWETDLLYIPGFIGSLVVGCLVFLALEVMWLPFGLVITVIGAPLMLCYRQGDCSAVCASFFNIDNDDDEVSSGAYVWFLPLAIAAQYLPQNDD